MPLLALCPARLGARVLALAGVLTTGHVQAHVECTVTPKKYYIGSNGYLSISWVEGGTATVEGVPAGVQSVLATVHQAMVSGRPLVVRYPDGSLCTGKQTLQGLWLAQ